MNALPDHRRAIHGRTHDRAWHPTDFDPITRYRARDRAVDRALLAALGITCVLLALMWKGWL